MTEVKGVAASQERVVVEASHLEGGDGTVLTGLRLWSASNTAVTYNRWQSLFFALIRDFKLTDTEAQPGESQEERQTRVRSSWNFIQGEIHGPDHAAQAVRAGVLARTGMPAQSCEPHACIKKLRQRFCSSWL